MSRTENLEIAGPDVVAEDFGSEIVVVNLATGHYFSLRGLAASIWRDLTNGAARSNIVAAIAGQAEDLGAAARDFVAELLANGLVRAAGEPSLPPATLHSADPAATQGGPPVLEIFEDMADLILADPIHDVDEETGWPIRKPAPAPSA